jgi:hypothetical protein
MAMTTPRDATAKDSTGQLDPNVRYHRIQDWIHNEEHLIATRIGWFLASEAFMVTGYAISASKTPAITSITMTVLLPLLGMLLAIRIRYPVNAALSTIDLWINKEREFFEEFPLFKVLDVPERDPALHWRSWLFPKELPWFFLGFWALLFAATVAQLVLQRPSILTAMP